MNVCLLDLSKAFDKMNHFALSTKLMNRSISVQLLSVIENRFALCLSCVEWGKVTSYYYKLTTGVWQGGVFSPCLFGIFIDDLVNKADSGYGIGACCAAIFLYADVISVGVCPMGVCPLVRQPIGH